MWIRTSDKKRVIFCGTVGKLEVSKYKEKIDEVLSEAGTLKVKEAGYVLLNGECIGEYATEERSIEVLDEICNAYQYANECAVTGIGAMQPEFVYYMPPE